MTKRNPDIEGVPTVVSFVADSESITKFKQMVGDQNFSREIRAMIKDRVKLEKNEQALGVNPLNIMYNVPQSGQGNNTRQSTLFETFALKDRRDEISKWVNSISDMDRLKQIRINAKAAMDIAQNRSVIVGRTITNNRSLMH